LLPLVVLTVLLLVAAVGYALVIAGSVLPPSSESGDIAFVHATYGWSSGPTVGVTVADRRIYAVEADGGRPTLLAEVPGIEVQLFEGRLARRHGESGPAIQVSPDGQRIAFRVFNESAGLYVMNRDGTDLARLVELPGDAGTDGFALNSNYEEMAAGLAWSPDGARIAFSYPFYSMSAPVYVIDIDTGELRKITEPDPTRGASGMVAWSSDGSQLAFARWNDDGFLTEHGQLGPSSSLIVMNADGSGERELAVTEGGRALVGRIAWSPNGAVIAWVRSGVASSTEELVVSNADGSGTRRLAGGWGIHCCPFDMPSEPVAWSPDGTRIAFPRGDEIWVAWVDGSGLRKVTDGVSPSWSPDGTRLVFSRPALPIPGAPTPGLEQDPIAEQHRIYVINADGTGTRWLADGEYPVWTPNSGGGD
jgi:Tol biopolymer transport system component